MINNVRLLFIIIIHLLVNTCLVLKFSLCLHLTLNTTFS